jgi:peroxiredoxin
VVLVVLRGYPGYQCPLCNRQAEDLIKNAEALAAAAARVILVYPGPASDLKKRSEEFLTGKNLPASFDLVLDPDYEFTKLYDLRWDAPQETAYPSTFIVDRKGIVLFSNISKSHGGRIKASEILSVLGRSRHADQ